MSNADTVKALYEAFGKGDVPTVLGGMDPNIAWQEAEGNPYKGDVQAWVGPDAIVQNVFMKIGGEWEGFTITPATYADAGDQVIVQGRQTGKFKATGKSMDAEFCHIWTLAGDKLTSFKQYTDTAQLQAVMGVN